MSHPNSKKHGMMAKHTHTHKHNHVEPRLPASLSSTKKQSFAKKMSEKARKHKKKIISTAVIGATVGYYLKQHPDKRLAIAQHIKNELFPQTEQNPKSNIRYDVVYNSYNSYETIIKNTISKCTSLQKSKNRILYVQLDTYITNQLKLLQILSALTSAYLNSKNEGGRLHKTHPNSLNIYNYLKAESKKKGGMTLNDYETTVAVIWYRKKTENDPPQNQIHVHTIKKTLIHVVNQTTEVTSFLDTLRSRKSEILSINYDTYMGGVQNMVAQTVNSSGGIETTSATIFYCETQALPQIQYPPVARLLTTWAEYSVTSYTKLLDDVIQQCTILQTNGFDIYNVQLDTFLPLLQDHNINKTNTIIWYSQRKKPAVSATQPPIKVLNVNSRLNGHRNLIKQTTSLIARKDITILNINIDTYTPVLFKILPEKTHICIFYMEHPHVN
mgnify:CR=1 FL=1